MKKFAHIINPVVVSPESDLFVAQPITFESMRIAKAYSQNTVDVDLITAQFEEDCAIIPDFFIQTHYLSSSIQHVGNFKRKRKLPLIKDILDRLYHQAENVDYLIYTNVDIALMPYFYLVVNDIVGEGYDAFVINRRTITERYTDIDHLNHMFAETGIAHPGHDCFVFKRALYSKFELGTACIGANWIGKVLIANLINYASKFKEFTDLHLTFHIGDNRDWKKPDYSDYDSHNENILSNVLRSYLPNREFANNSIIAEQLRRLKIQDDHEQRDQSLEFEQTISGTIRKIIKLIRSV